MTINIRTPIFLIFIIILWYSCNGGGKKDKVFNDAGKNQSDSTELNRTGFNAGQKLFKANCNSCHVAPEKHILDQYLFDNLFERMPIKAEDYFIKYISDSKQLKATGNEYANKVDAAWNSVYEHLFKDSLSSEDFVNLITYIKIAPTLRYQKIGG